jgi:DNA-binding NarL/FixJ family response regulator
MTRALPHPPVIVYTCTSPEPRVLARILETRGGGYLVKGEIMYALATALAAAAKGQFVMTPGVLIISGRMELPANTRLMDGTVSVAKFTPREKDLTRLGLLFNLSQRDIADDLIVSTDFVAEVMGQVYEKLGLREILSGERALESYFQDEKLLERYRAIVAQSAETANKPGRKVPWMSTLAFHLLTVPDTTELD